jgi:hypothetical protein
MVQIELDENLVAPPMHPPPKVRVSNWGRSSVGRVKATLVSQGDGSTSVTAEQVIVLK